LKQKLERAELAARSSSFYLCPGYNEKRCNGRYSEEEAQSVVDPATGLFLCQECVVAYESTVDPPLKSTYTLQLVDNAAELKLAMDNMRRFHVQLSGKMIGSEQMRPSIFDLLQQVRVKGKGPLTSNLPSENFALGIGSKRLAGTGRTAGIKAKKLAQQHIKTAVVGTTSRKDDAEIFLKNAIGQEIKLLVEKGGGARAQLLATNRRRIRKLLDAAASRIGTTLPMHFQLQYILAQQQKEKEARKQEEAKSEQTKKSDVPAGPDFLNDNIGRQKRKWEALQEDDRNEDDGDKTHDEQLQVLIDDRHELLGMTEDERKDAFQAQYKMEMIRQAKILKLEEGFSRMKSKESEAIQWEDG
jgi:hypothetical protein